MEIKYFVLPSAQRQAGAAALKTFLLSPAGQTLVFIKAVSLVISVPPHHKKRVCVIMDIYLHVAVSVGNIWGAG